MISLVAGGIPIARLFGIEIRIHLSWILILAVIAVAVVGQLQVSQPLWHDGLRWGVAGLVALLFLVSVLVHELVHGLVARRRGLGGGTVTLLFFGGSASAGREPTRPVDEAWIAASGPAASVLIAGAFLLLLPVAAVVPETAGQAIAQISVLLAALNVFLAVLNLLPIYPLDGGRILRATLWHATGSQSRATRGVVLVSRLLGWLLIAAGIAVIFVGDPLDGLMLTVSGWFVSGTARAVERRRALEDLLRGVLVESVMERDLPSISPQLTLDTFAGQYLASEDGASLPVMRDDTLLGLIGYTQLRRVRRSAWATTRAEDVMVSPPALPLLAPDDELTGALDRLRRTGLDGLPVLRGTELLGILTRRGIVRTIQAAGQPTVTVQP